MFSHEQLADWDRRYIWHPFTQMSEWLEGDPIIIESGDGIYLYDDQGRRYMDGISSIWLNLHGHRNEYINNAIIEQLGKIAHSTLLGMSNVPSIILAKRLVDIAPAGLEKVFYSDNGSTAVEIALKMAFHYWMLAGSERPYFVSLTNAYHGDTIGSVSVGGIPLFHSAYRQLLFKTLQCPAPYCYRCHLELEYPDCGLSCLEEVEKVIEKEQGRISAFIIEPVVQGAAGMIMMPDGYLKRVRELCDKYGIFLIADEVAVGFGRTGAMFACEHEKVTPDFLCIAKGITGGYLPLAATLTTTKVFNAFLGKYEEFKTFFHGHSFTGNQLGCAAAIANLDIFYRDEIIIGIKEKAAFLSGEMAKFKLLKHAGDVRQRGLIAAIELVKNKDTKEAFPVEMRIGHKVCLEAKRLGLLTRPLGNIIPLMPPYSSTEEEISIMSGLLYEAIKNTVGK